MSRTHVATMVYVSQFLAYTMACLYPGSSGFSAETGTLVELLRKLARGPIRPCVHSMDASLRGDCGMPLYKHAQGFTVVAVIKRARRTCQLVRKPLYRDRGSFIWEPQPEQ
jgi:hypothetical protein